VAEAVGWETEGRALALLLRVARLRLGCAVRECVGLALRLAAALALALALAQALALPPLLRERRAESVAEAEKGAVGRVALGLRVGRWGVGEVVKEGEKL
jgi:hypothetical protein